MAGRLQRAASSQSVLLMLLVTATLGLWAVRVVRPEWVTGSAFVMVILLAGFWLRVQAFVVLSLLVNVVTVAITMTSAGHRFPFLYHVALLITNAAVIYFAWSRQRLGVQGSLGAAMLIDLRDRLQSQANIPQLPRGWQIESKLSTAYGDSFSGDFVVATRSTDGRTLELSLVDVSGKGQAAGARALQLSGAFGGLLGAMEPPDFLPAANAYLLRQRWEEGFATAIHLMLDLTSGDYRLANAGHPPAAHFHAGSGRWEIIDGDHGPALGILDGVDFPGHEAHLSRGDALLLYTDGMVETPGRDLVLGIDRLMGQAEILVGRHGGFYQGAARIMAAARSDDTDDRAVVIVWRSPDPNT